jgi:hypothetical protein
VNKHGSCQAGVQGCGCRSWCRNSSQVAAADHAAFWQYNLLLLLLLVKLFMPLTMLHQLLLYNLLWS